MNAFTRWQERIQHHRQALQQLLADIRAFPWRTTAWTLRERFRADRLGSTAGSLTFTTTISLVPLITVALAIFSAFPMFSRMEGMLQKWFIDNLIPENIARQVSRYLLLFASKAGQMGWVGALFLFVTALALVLTIDRKLNDIWRVRVLRPLAQRVLVYWAVLTLGPLLVGVSLSISSYALSASKGWVGGMRAEVLMLLDVLEFCLVVGAMAALYRYVPNARVRWSHAAVGGVFVALGIAGAQKLLAWYLAAVPTYSVLYGAFATVPILLVWIYLSWVIVLLGAVMVAYLPSLLAGIARRGDSPGWEFQMAIEVLGELYKARSSVHRGMGLVPLSQRLRVDPLQLERPIEVLQSLDWVGRLEEDEERYVLLIEPQDTSLGPLAQLLLLPREPGTQNIWALSAWDRTRLAEALPA